MSGKNGSNPRLIPANTTLLQPVSQYFRLGDALQNVYPLGEVQTSVATLQAQVTTLQAEVSALGTAVSTLQSQMLTAQGQISTLQSQMATVQSQISTLQLFMNSFNYLQAEVSTGTIYLDQRTIYRRSFVINSALNTPLTNTLYPHNVPAISYIVAIQAIASVPQQPQYPITFINAATAPNINTGVSIWADATNIVVSVGATALANYQVMATMFYTATNR